MLLQGISLQHAAVQAFYNCTIRRESEWTHSADPPAVPAGLLGAGSSVVGTPAARPASARGTPAQRHGDGRGPGSAECYLALGTPSTKLRLLPLTGAAAATHWCCRWLWKRQLAPEESKHRRTSQWPVALSAFCGPCRVTGDCWHWWSDRLVYCPQRDATSTTPHG
jgi:hypothetical protein